MFMPIEEFQSPHHIDLQPLETPLTSAQKQHVNTVILDKSFEA